MLTLSRWSRWKIAVLTPVLAAVAGAWVLCASPLMEGADPLLRAMALVVGVWFGMILAASLIDELYRRRRWLRTRTEVEDGRVTAVRHAGGGRWIELRLRLSRRGAVRYCSLQNPRKVWATRVRPGDLVRARIRKRTDGAVLIEAVAVFRPPSMSTPTAA